MKITCQELGECTRTLLLVGIIIFSTTGLLHGVKDAQACGDWSLWIFVLCKVVMTIFIVVNTIRGKLNINMCLVSNGVLSIVGTIILLFLPNCIPRNALFVSGACHVVIGYMCIGVVALYTWNPLSIE